MKNISFWKKSFYSAMVFFGTLLVLSLGYAALSSGLSDADKVGSGSGLTASSWNKIVSSILELDTRTTGIFASTLESVKYNVVQNGVLSNDLLYTSGPTITLTLGNWIVYGHSTVTTGSNPDTIMIGIYDNTNSVEYGLSPGGSSSLTTPIVFSTEAFISVPSGANKVIYLKGHRNGASSLIMGQSTASQAGASLRAVRIN